MVKVILTIIAIAKDENTASAYAMTLADGAEHLARHAAAEDSSILGVRVNGRFEDMGGGDAAPTITINPNAN